MNVEKDEIAGKMPSEITPISTETTISEEHMSEKKETSSNTAASAPADDGASGTGRTEAASIDASSFETVSADVKSAKTALGDSDSTETDSADTGSTETNLPNTGSKETVSSEAGSKETTSSDAGSKETTSADTDSTATSSITADETTSDTEIASEESTLPKEPVVEKKIDKKRLLRGILELTVASLILMFSAYLFYNTRGTRLLFVNATFGLICRYYWVGLLVAAIVGLAGWLTLKRQPKTVDKTEDTKEDTN